MTTKKQRAAWVGLGGVMALAAVGTVLSLGAVADYRAAQVARVDIGCTDEDPADGTFCAVDIWAVRPMRPAAVAEAVAAGIEPVAARDVVLKRRVRRDLLRTFLQTQTTALP